jgi:hypothetical protein
MPRLMSGGLDLGRRGQRLASHGTLELSVITPTGTRSYYLATAKLNFNGVQWRPDLRDSGEITGSIIAEADEATIAIQNVDTLFGIEAVSIADYLSNADARVGRYELDPERGSESHEILMTGLVVGLDPNEQSVQLTIVPDTYSGVSVGPYRHIRRLCQFFYKGDECGRPATDPPTCDFTLNGAGGCDGRWGATEKIIHHGGEPYLDNQVFQKII